MHQMTDEVKEWTQRATKVEVWERVGGKWVRIGRYGDYGQARVIFNGLSGLNERCLVQVDVLAEYRVIGEG